jgi:hypothetical protein
MPLKELLEQFGLDAELIERDRDMSTGLGRAHARHAEGANDANARLVHELAAATEFRRAGAHCILLSDRRAAAENFNLAGESYGRLGNPYGLLMFVCAEYSPTDLAAPGDKFGFFERTRSDPAHEAYLWLTAAAGGWGHDRLRHRREELRGSLSSPIGILGLPLGASLDLADALAAGQINSILQASMPFLVAYSTAMIRARENRYHWRRMALPFHAAEPDILGIIFLVEATTRSRGEKFISLVREMASLHPDSVELLYSATLERFSEPR